jgi:hypothetical protein
LRGAGFANKRGETNAGISCRTSGGRGEAVN